MRRSIRILSARFAAIAFATATACSTEGTEPAPERTAILTVGPKQSTIAQGDSTVLSISFLAPEPGGDVQVTVSGAPTGVTTSITDLQTNGLLTTAFVHVSVAADAAVGTDSLRVQGIQNGVVVVTEIAVLIVFYDPVCHDSGVACNQWARDAVASTEYSLTLWNTKAAIGGADVAGCEDDPHAWASAEQNGIDWLEVSYLRSVIPIEIQIFEVYGVSSIVSVQVKDVQGAYHTVYSDQPRLQACPRRLTIPVTFALPITAVRINLDQRLINVWNEIDAVYLVGRRP